MNEPTATIPVVTLNDPTTGLPCQVLRPAYESAIRRGEPIVITIWPEDIQPRSPKPMSDEDEVIAEIIDGSPGMTKSEITKQAAEHEAILSADSFKNRFRKGSPLQHRGYHSKSYRYYPPQEVDHAE